MEMNKLAEILDTEGFVLADGATGTELFARGLTSGDPPEQWNVIKQEPILDIHRTYIRAGSRLILTNTFGGTTYRLKLHNLQDQSYELNKCGAELAQQAASEVPQTIVVAGSIGPTGEILLPMGQMSYEEAVASFAIQARGLADGGADVFWIETMSDIDEVRAAVEGIRSVSDLPICATMTFDTKGRTMMGVTPQDAIRALTEIKLDAIGANCGNGTDEIEAVIALMHEISPETILIVKSNAGMPQWIKNELIYDGTPTVMAEYALRVRALGAKIIGGCCGSSSLHIAAMAEALGQPVDEDMVVQARGYIIPDAKTDGTAEEKPSRRRRRRKTTVKE